MNRKIVAIRQSIANLLSILGLTYQVPFSDGRKTMAVILTLRGVRQLGIDLNRIYNDSGGFKAFDEKTGRGLHANNGVLVELDVCKLIMLLEAIIERRPELRDRLGFYTLEGAERAARILGEERVGATRQLGQWSMFSIGRGRKEGIVTLKELGKLEDNHFYSFGFDDGSDDDFDYRNVGGVAVFGIQI